MPPPFCAAVIGGLFAFAHCFFSLLFFSHSTATLALQRTATRKMSSMEVRRLETMMTIPDGSGGFNYAMITLLKVLLDHEDPSLYCNRDHDAGRPCINVGGYQYDIPRVLDRTRDILWPEGIYSVQPEISKLAEFFDSFRYTPYHAPFPEPEPEPVVMATTKAVKRKAPPADLAEEEPAQAALSPSPVKMKKVPSAGAAAASIAQDEDFSDPQSQPQAQKAKKRKRAPASKEQEGEEGSEVKKKTSGGGGGGGKGKGKGKGKPAAEQSANAPLIDYVR